MDLFNRKKVQELENELLQEKQLGANYKENYENLIKSCIENEEKLTAFFEHLYNGKHVQLTATDQTGATNTYKWLVKKATVEGGQVRVEYEDPKGIAEVATLDFDVWIDVKTISKKTFLS